MNFIQILELETSEPTIPINLLKSYTNLAVDRLMDYSQDLIRSSTPDCVQLPLNHKRTAVDLTVIIDGSRTFYENSQFIHSVAELVDVSFFGSYISVIHGTTGQYLVNRTNSLSNLYEQLRNSSFVPSEFI
jgi:hypothetical protein